MIAVTGNGTHDAYTLSKADIGFSFCNRPGAGISKNSSNIVLENESFKSILEAIISGRAIYANVRKFLQLQLTMNIMTMGFVMFASIFTGDSPLIPVHLLWLNIIMDILGALSLSTDPPSLSILKNQKPLKRDEKIMTPAIARNIILMAAFQFANNMYMLFFPAFLGFDYNENDPFFTEDSLPTQKCVHYTIVYHTFILQTTCQMINARKVYEKDFNVFEGIGSNPIYLAIMVATLVIQVMFVQMGGQLFRCAPLTMMQHVNCLVQALVVLVVAAIVKLVPSRYFLWF